MWASAFLWPKMTFFCCLFVWDKDQSHSLDPLNKKEENSFVFTSGGILAIYYHCPLDFTQYSLRIFIRIMFLLGQKESSIRLNLALPVKWKSCIERRLYCSLFPFILSCLCFNCSHSNFDFWTLHLCWHYYNSWKAIMVFKCLMLWFSSRQHLEVYSASFSDSQSTGWKLALSSAGWLGN